jgi:hypothetical protein
VVSAPPVKLWVVKSNLAGVYGGGLKKGIIPFTYYVGVYMYVPEHRNRSIGIFVVRNTRRSMLEKGTNLFI